MRKGFEREMDFFAVTYYFDEESIVEDFCIYLLQIDARAQSSGGNFT